MRRLLSKCGDRELFWVMIGFFVLLVLGLNTLAGAATVGPSDVMRATAPVPFSLAGCVISL